MFYLFIFLFIWNIPKRINYIMNILILTFIDYVSWSIVRDGQSNNVVY